MPTLLRLRMDFLVDLEVFRGPLDLLLYLVRKHEVEITEIPIAPITDQFLDYLAVIEQLDVDAVGDFLDMASTLVEIKSRMVLPRSEEIEEPLDDPRRELVERLLEYKRFKDAATILEERSRDWQERYPRLASDLVERRPIAGRGTDPRSLNCGTWSALSAAFFASGRRPSRRASSTTIRRSTSTWPASMPSFSSAGNWRSANCFGRIDTNRRRSAFSWRSLNWSAITTPASSRTSCTAKSGCCRARSRCGRSI